MSDTLVRVELSFNDDAARRDGRVAHRERLTTLHRRGALVAAGPWQDDSGALLMFRLDEPSVRTELADDPYYTLPGVTVVAVFKWAPIVGFDS